MILGIDVSTYLEELEHGAVYLDGDTPMDPLDAFVENGVNWMRIRVWNDPKSEVGEPYLAGNNDIREYIRLAKLAKSKGYHLLLEKPIAPAAQECADIEKLALERGRHVVVCHVLRYTVFYQKLKELVDSGVAGEVVSIQAIPLQDLLH